KDMAKNLPVLGAQFQALKMGGNEAAATMGAALQIARKGASTSDEAANNMNNFMAKILSPETLKKAQKNFGVDMYKIVTSAQKKGQNPFEAAMKSVIKMTKNGDQKLLGELFGDMQVQNFVRPMIQNWEEYRRIKETSLGAGGAVVDRDFANITKDNAERLKQLRIQASNAALSFGQALQPALNAALGVLVPLLTKVSEFVANNPNLVSQIVLTAGALLAMRTAVIACRVAMLALSVATKMTPFGWIQLAISALVAAGVLLYQNWDKIKACAVKVWPTIREYGVKALEGLKFVFMNFTPVGWLVQAFKAGADILNTINWSDSGAKIIETLITGIKSKANALVDEVKGVFATVREYLPFSDAKRGPFSQLTKSGGAIMATLASGVNGSNSLQTAISGKFGQTRFSPHGISVAGGLSSRSGASGGTVIPPGGITYAPVINLPPGSPKETEAAVQRALDAGYSDFEKKMNAHLFQSRRLSFG
ncbi:phage tail tape measure protein, partial [Salmonella enterica]|nr:phage tail tape measure protein [Salmonella enterica]